MRLLHITDTLDPRYGGTPAAVNNLAHGLTGLGCSNTIIYLASPSDKSITPPFDNVGLPGRIGRYKYSPELVSALKRSQHKYDAVIVHGVWTYASLGTWQALRSAGLPYFVFPHGMLDPWFKRYYPLKHLKKFIYWILLERMVIRDAAAVLYTSEEEKIGAGRTFWPYSPAREEVVGLGIQSPGPISDNSGSDAFYALYPELRGKRILLFLGRLHPKKGCDLLLEAINLAGSHTPNVKYVFAGPGDDKINLQLRSQARRLGISENVMWVGMLQGSTKWAALRAAEALILPSHQENFGIVVAEAMACGRPVLISNKVNIWREIEADGAGLVESDTVQGALRLISRFFSLSDAERLQLGQNASRSFARRFTAQVAARQTLDALQRR
jgi:glycosyltransferase involved in cell wall biosynthesis